MDTSEGQLEVQDTASEIYHRVNKKKFHECIVNVLGRCQIFGDCVDKVVSCLLVRMAAQRARQL